MQVVNLLNRVVGNRGRSLQKIDEWMWWSPFIHHHKPKLQINVKTGKWHCWVSNNGGHNLFQLFKKLKATQEQFDELSELFKDVRRYKKVKEEKKICQLPKEFKSLLNKEDTITKRHALAHLKKRKIDKKTILRYNIGYCESGLYENRIVVPSYDSDGNLNYFIARNIFDGGMKYKNPPVSKDVVGFDLFINWDEPIVLCEGVFDAIAVRRNAIPLFGKTIPKSVMKKIFEKRVERIYILLDSDAYWDSIEMTDILMRNGIDVNFIKLEEKDPSEIGFRKVIDILKQSKKVSFSDLIRMKLDGKSEKHLEVW
jgi:DNA primase|tara:strand:- start:170 stop:1105 length:936 start_codon:yes stop_codon:yes gene_type:complete